jgi:Predicted nucleotide kinase
MKWFITGQPGSGKTTLVTLIVEKLRFEGINIDGIITKEIKEGGARTGFQILDIKTKNKGILASKKLKVQGPRVGSYTVNLEDIEIIAVQALERAYNNADLIVIDEIGTMELFSQSFRNIVGKILKSNKNCLSTIHRNHLNMLELVQSNEKKLYTVTKENWPQVFNEISNDVLNFFKSAYAKT